MKTIRKGAIIGAALLLASNIHTFAIEGLTIKAQCPNIVLTWPSVAGEIYIVRYRSTLDNGVSWMILTNSLPARTGTNTTFFIHPNQIVCSTNTGGGGGGGQGGPPPLPGMASSSTIGATTAAPAEPLVKRADGSGSAVPIELYPPGFDLTGFLILDPATDQWLSGDGQIIAMPSPSAVNGMQLNGPQPLDGGSGGVTSGFYEVVRVGPHFFGLTNGMVLSGVVSLPMEFGNTNTTASLDLLFLFGTNGGPVPNGSRSPLFRAALPMA